MRECVNLAVVIHAIWVELEAAQTLIICLQLSAVTAIPLRVGLAAFLLSSLDELCAFGL